MYPLETRELAVEAVAAGFSLTEAAELAGCSRTAVVNWAKAAGVAPPPRKKAVYLPFDRKMELVARLEAGERAADLAAEAGVTAAAVSGWRRRRREEGALSLVNANIVSTDWANVSPHPRQPIPANRTNVLSPTAPTELCSPMALPHRDRSDYWMKGTSWAS